MDHRSSGNERANAVWRSLAPQLGLETGAGGTAATGVPQAVQNAAPCARTPPQRVQNLLIRYF